MSSVDRLCATDGDPLSTDDATMYHIIVGGILPLLVQTYFMELIVFVSTFMLLAVHIGFLPNVFFNMFMVQFLMVFSFSLLVLVLCLLILMLTRLVVLMISYHGGICNLLWPYFDRLEC
jgi:hypothetical protein